MVALWVIIGLVISTFCVSILGAAFSVVGLGALFSGAMLAVWGMAGSLEFSKFVLAAYLHQRWKHLNLIFKSYLVFAVVVLSMITSMGIFGFLSDAYQSSSNEMEEVNINIANFKSQQGLNKAEVDRLTKMVEEIPANRVSKRLRLRAEIEPTISKLTKDSEEIDKKIGLANLKMLEIKKKIGPLIYISRALNKDIDTIVKYLILVFVSVFDPLAICLVIATSEALDSRKKMKLAAAQVAMTPQGVAVPPSVVPASDTSNNPSSPVPDPTIPPSAIGNEQPPTMTAATSEPPPPWAGEDVEVIEMKYVDSSADSSLEKQSG